MLSMQMPTVLAVLGTVLMAIVIFAPAPARAAVTTSFAPPLPPPLDHWQPPSLGGLPIADDPFESMPVSVPAGEPATAEVPSWPGLVDASARDCDAGARRALVEALGSVRTAWAETILQRAQQEETDPLVLDALHAIRLR